MQFGNQHFVVSYTPNDPDNFFVYSDYLTEQIADISPAEQAKLYKDAQTVHLIRELMNLDDVAPTLSGVISNTQSILDNEALLSGLANAASTAINVWAGNPFKLTEAFRDVLTDALLEGPNVALWCVGRAYAELVVSRANTLFSTYLPSDWSTKEIDTSKIPEAWNLAVATFNLASAAQTIMEKAADITKTNIASISEFLSGVTLGIIDLPFDKIENAGELIELATKMYDILEVTGDIANFLDHLEGLQPAVNFSVYDPNDWLKYIDDFESTSGPGTYNVATSDQSGITSGGYSNGGTGTVTNGPDIIPGDTSSTFVIGATGQAVSSAIETAGDRDYFKAYFVQGDTYRIDITGFANHGYSALANSFFRVRDAQNAIKQSPADQVGGDQLDFVAPYTGWHFISVGAGGPNSANLIGGYSLTVTLINAPTANHAPVATNDDLYVQYGKVITANVLTNDSDVDNNVLSVDFLSSFQTVLGGTVDLVPNGSFQYEAPANGTNGAQDSFVYTVRDGAGGSATGTVHINLTAPPGSLFTTGDDYQTVPGGGGIYHALAGNDVVFGSNWADLIYGEDGNDFFHGFAGNDYLAGGNGNDGFVGGPGDDWFVPGPGTNHMWGDGVSTDFGGFDTTDYSSATGPLVINMAQGTVTGGGVNDLLDGIDQIILSSFADQITAAITAVNVPNITVHAGDGADLAVGSPGNDTLYGEAGDDNLQARLGNDHLYGGDGNDSLYGDDGDDILNGGAGDDGVFGESGDDYIFASAGTDWLRGLDGIDTVDFSNAPGAATGGLGGIVVNGWGTSTIDGFEKLVASAFDDSIQVSGASFLELHAGAGNDTVPMDTGFAGTVYGEDGDDLTIDIWGGSETVFGGAGNDRLFLGQGNNIGYGGLGNDRLITGSGLDVLYGEDGNDILNGGGGADDMTGGLGDDLYVIDNAGDVVTELASEGADLVETSLVAYTLGTNVENLTGTLGAAQSLIGNELANTITGGAGADIINGVGGIDTMGGGDGDDTYIVDATGDVITEGAGGASGVDVAVVFANYTLSANVEVLYGLNSSIGLTLNGIGGNDTIYGSNQSDTINGGGGNDTLLGFDGTNAMAGGAGDDTYYTASAADSLTEAAAAGFDIVVASYDIILGANLEQLAVIGAATSGTGNGEDNFMSGANSTNGVTLNGAGGNDFLYGSLQSDTLIGGAGNDLLIGLDGTNTMTGGTNDDVYYSFSATDIINENSGEGFDTVVAFTSINLSNNIEQLIVQGTATNATGTGGNEIIYGLNSGLGLTLDGGVGNDTIYGSNQSDNLIGGTGNDIILGFGGTNSFTGGAGDDQYYTSSAIDTLTEGAAGGNDIVVASYNKTLDANFEQLILIGSATSGTGNGDNNVLNGAIAGAGATLDGAGGNDNLFGSGFADTLAGGTGDDVMFGDAGADTFDFSTTGFGNDIVSDFVTTAVNAGTHDLLDLQGYGFTDISGLNLVYGGSGATITIGADTIFLTGVTSGLQNSDFLF
jgi:Ca2+-binding RTX toxin-like protein